MKNYLRFKREKALKFPSFFTNSISKLSKIAMLASCFWATNAVAQTQKSEPIAVVNNKGNQSLEDQRTEFVGGQRALFAFLSDSLQFPNREKYGSYNGTVYVSFVITKTGEIKDAVIKKGLLAELNNEALRLVKLTAGKWKPGRENGQLIDTNYTLPVKFTLD